MNIAIVIRSVIPAIHYGGTERVMWSLGKALHRMGHCVTFLAARGSKSAGGVRVIEINPARGIAQQIPHGTDVIHFNDFVPDESVPCPYVVTYHGNGMKGELDLNTIFVSRNHALRFSSNQYVYNGLDWDDYPRPDLSLQRSRYHFLGKAAWSVKNVRGCISVIRRLPGAELDVLGGYRFNFKMGLRFTFSPRIHFHGMVDNEMKAHVIQNSRGLLFPVLWDEPFGLAIIESLYYGAPVFGTIHGSLPELVIPEVGRLVATRDELYSALLQAYDFRPEICHQYSSDMFNAEVMAKAYLAKYETVLAGLTLNAIAPHPINPYTRYEF